MAKGLQAQPLNVLERGELRKAEAAIEKGQQTFMDVGNALAAIRDRRLYREGHKTFEAYCKDRWNIQRNYANKLIAGAKVVEDLGTMVPKLTERQARELGNVPEEEREAVLEWATEKADGKPLTAAAIKQAVAEVLEAEPEEETGQSPPTVEDRMTAGNSELDGLARKIMGLIKEAEAIDNPHLIDEKHGRLATLAAQLRSAAGTVRAAKGAGVCTYCHGEGCRHCLKTGWLTKVSLDSAPEEAA